MEKRTKLSTCTRKRRYRTEGEAVAVALAGGLALRPYRCDRCGQFHLTSRTKGKRPMTVRVAMPIASH